MKKKICIVTGSRAEYGLLRWVMYGVTNSINLELQLVVTGMHLSPEFGFTFKEIIADGFTIDRKVEMLMSSNNNIGIAKSIGVGMLGFGDVWADLKPDLILVLGDRFEIFAAVASAMVSQIPIAHVHGGEKTEGSIDELMRHSITKMSHLHFVATDEYRNRVIQLGEIPSRVFNVGGLGIDGIKKLKLLSAHELENSLGIKFGHKNLLVTFHPEAVDDEETLRHVKELLQAFNTLNDTHLFFTMPNADAGSWIIKNEIELFKKTYKHCWLFTSMGQLNYFSMIQIVDGVIGNSSSGILEVPTFFKGSINIGHRQKGRLRSSSVIDCATNKTSIIEALSILYSKDFQSSLSQSVNPYGNGGASERIVSTLSSYPLKNLIGKVFHDI